MLKSIKLTFMVILVLFIILVIGNSFDDTVLKKCRLCYYVLFFKNIQITFNRYKYCSSYLSISTILYYIIINMCNSILGYMHHLTIFFNNFVLTLHVCRFQLIVRIHYTICVRVLRDYL